VTVSAMPHRTILAVDGNSLAHRAYHAMVGGDDAVGHFVTAGIVAMLGSVWGAGPFDGIVMAFDHAHNQRREDWPVYKADRVTDPALRDHLQALPAHMEACGFQVEVTRGAEADDLLAAAADACTSRGWRCAILSSDRDLTALVSDTVTLLRPRATMSDLRVYDPGTVHREYGVSPAQYTDLAALRGDPSDGLEGVHGIGAKTAARLLRDHGSLGAIYANLHHLPPKVEAALRAGRDVAERNRLLMSPLPNLSVDVDAAVASGVDLARIEQALTALEIPGAATRFRWTVERPTPPRPPLPPLPDDAPSGHGVPDTVRARRQAQEIADEADQHALF
jgi:5'-3' exonuclease